MTPHHLHRRQFCHWMAAGIASAALPAGAESPPRPIADMHSHYSMFRSHPFDGGMGNHLRANGVSLLAWALVDDSNWIAPGPGGITQKSTPAPGELWPFFVQRATRMKEQLAQWNLPLALTPQDVDAAVGGKTHVVLASEAASFLEGDVSRLAAAHAMGLRHTQVVHYIESPLGDFQTAEPKRGGLSAVGRQMVTECKRLGILVDLAHGTESLVDAAFDASDAPMVWSHSWIRETGGAWMNRAYIARSLSRNYAKKIADRGGVIGLWSLRVSDPSYPVRDVRTFADETMRMVDLVGAAHVGFGTDMDGTGNNPILDNYADLRTVADDLARRGLSEGDLQSIFIGNYARVLKQAMAGAQRTS